MTTFLRPFPRNVLTTKPRVLCDACSRFDNGIPVTPEDETEQGERCWAPIWSVTPTPCAECGQDANRRIHFEDLPDRCKVELGAT